MVIYTIGGCVRDILLGLSPRDLDYVVVGGSHEEMIALNFTKVGADFPVYLHPDTRDEYALARTETKHGVGYLGFDVVTHDVSLAEDQSRRDLTINQLAVRIEDWDMFVKTKDEMLVLDAFNGIQDLKDKILRHNTVAFRCDPVRILRTARFAARYNFSVHPDTIELMRKVLPELDTIPQERIWAEFEKGLMEKYPSRMFDVLTDCDTFGRAGPMVLKPYKYADFGKLSQVCDKHDITVRFALINSGFVGDDYKTCRIPSDCASVGFTFNLVYAELQSYPKLSTNARLALLMQLKAFSHPWLLVKCLEVFSVYDVVSDGYTVEDVIACILGDLEAISTVSGADIAATCTTGKDIGRKIFEARVQIMDDYMVKKLARV
jgi:tRNA nucleotidyltransferase (CCA-adding enzyme)